MKSHYLIIPFTFRELIKARNSSTNLRRLTEDWVTKYGDVWKANPDNYKRKGPKFNGVPSITSLSVPSNQASHIKEIKVIYYGHPTTYDFERLEDGVRIYIFAHGDPNKFLINTGGPKAVGITPDRLNIRLFKIMPSTQRNVKYKFRLFACEGGNTIKGDTQMIAFAELMKGELKRNFPECSLEAYEHKLFLKKTIKNGVVSVHKYYHNVLTEAKQVVDEEHWAKHCRKFF